MAPNACELVTGIPVPYLLTVRVTAYHIPVEAVTQGSLADYQYLTCRAPSSLCVG